MECVYVSTVRRTHYPPKSFVTSAHCVTWPQSPAARAVFFLRLIRWLGSRAPPPLGRPPLGGLRSLCDGVGFQALYNGASTSGPRDEALSSKVVWHWTVYPCYHVWPSEYAGSIPRYAHCPYGSNHGQAGIRTHDSGSNPYYGQALRPISYSGSY